VEGYISEEQQVEAIKKWWKENGMAVVAGAILGLGILFGGRAWFDYRQTQAGDSSMKYSMMLQAAESGRSDDAIQLGQALLVSGTGDYPAMSALMLARLELKRGNTDAAATQLQWVIDNGKMAGLKSVATLRLARLSYMQGDSDAALSQLAKPISAEFAAAVAELKGDIYAARGDGSAARAAYQSALAASGGSDTSTLEMKSNNLVAEVAQ